MNDNEVLLKRKKITYEHDETLYVPVFQKNFNEDGDLLFSPTFAYSMEDATHDEQMAASFEPDYILVLTGHFKATTKDIILKEENNEKK